MAAQLATIAPRKTIRGSTSEELRQPEETISKPCARFVALNHTTRKTSFDSSLNRGLKSLKTSSGEFIAFFGISENSGYLKLVSLNFQTRVLNFTTRSDIVRLLSVSGEELFLFHLKLG